MGPFKDDQRPDHEKHVEGNFSFDFLKPGPLTELETEKMRISLKKIDPNARYHQKYRTELEKCELLAHLAYEADTSVQRIIEDRLFKRTWRTELEALRERHRKAGKKDWEFYPASVKQKLGLKVKTGRHKLKRNLTSAAA